MEYLFVGGGLVVGYVAGKLAIQNGNLEPQERPRLTPEQERELRRLDHERERIIHEHKEYMDRIAMKKAEMMQDIQVLEDQVREKEQSKT